LSTTGYDFSLTYTDIGIGRFGSLNVNITGTLLDELITKPAAIVDEYDCVGFYSNACEEPTPKWRHRARLGWVTPWNLDFSLTWRYQDSVKLFRPAVDNTIDEKLDSTNYFDLSANWAVTDKISVLLGIDNVLDEDPPITSAVGTTGNGNTFPQTYDALGRFGFIRAQIGF
jgi:iron complex outermembrane receptor protein